MQSIMKKSNNLLFIAVFTRIIWLFASCTSNASFTSNEMRFAEPFEKARTVVFKSETGELDSVRFLNRKIDTIKHRNLEQGFYNENVLSVGYELTKNSYHKCTIISINKDPEPFLQFLKAKNSHSSRELSFLGLVFNEDYLDKIINTKDSTIVFKEEDAKYTGVNINEGIKSFKFDFNKGVLSFIDKRGNEWVRLN